MITLEEFKKAFDEEFVDELLSRSSKNDAEQLEIFREALRRAVAMISNFDAPDEDKRDAVLSLTKIFLLERFHLSPEETESLRRQARDVVNRMHERTTPAVGPCVGKPFSEDDMVFKRPNRNNDFLKIYRI